MEDLHRRLLRIGFDAGDDLGLVLAGGYALAAHELVSRPSRDVDFATSTARPLPDVAARLAEAYRAAGLDARVVEATPRMARLVVDDSGSTCEVDLLKEAIGPPAVLDIGPVLALPDAVGLKVRALYDRAAHRDFIDLRAAASRFGRIEMEALGARHTAGFSLEELAERLGAVGELDERTFVAYGLSTEEIAGLRRWALDWQSDILERVAAGEDAPPSPIESEWDSYVDERDASIEDFCVRAAGTGDLEALRDIERAAGEPFRGIGMPEVADDEPFPVAELARYQRAGTAWVVDAAGAPVGYLVAEVVDDALHIEQVSVDPGWARRGLGRRLIEHAAGYARLRGIPGLTLTTFADVPWNAPYYARCGFRVLADDEVTPGLRAIRHVEAEHGLDRWPRVCMRRILDGTSAVLTAFVAETERLAEVVSGLDAEDWTRPSPCPPWTVAELFGHVLTAVSRVPGMLAEPAPPRAEVSAAGYYRPDERFSAGTNADRVDVARRRADVGGPELARAFDGTRRDVLRACAAEPPGRVVRTRHGDAMLLADFLITRVVELGIHGLDLAVALGRRPWLTAPATEVLMALLLDDRARAALRDLGWDDVTFLAKATGRDAMSPDERAALDRLGIRWLALG